MTAMLLALHMMLGIGTPPGAAAQTPSATSRARADRLIERIVGMMKSGDLDVQERAEQAIRSLNERDRTALLSVSSEEFWEREFAWFLLTRARDRRVIPYLRHAVEPGDVSDTCRLRAIEYLGELSDAGSVDTLIRFVRSRHDLMRAALGALGRIDDPRARQALLEFLEDPDLFWVYRQDAVVAAGRQHDASAVPAILRIVGRHYDDPDVALSFRSAAAVALAQIGTPDSVDAAVNLIRDIRPGQRGYDTKLLVAFELRLLEKRTRDALFRRRLRTLVSEISPRK